MIAGLLTGIATSPWIRATLRHDAPLPGSVSGDEQAVHLAAYLFFLVLAKIGPGFALCESAVAMSFSFTFLGFFASRLPRFLSPLLISVSPCSGFLEN